LAALAAANGITQRSQSELVGTPPAASIQYKRDCNGLGMPSNMKTIVDTTVASQVITTETDGTNTWITTQTTSAASGVGAYVTTTCPTKQ
jgi:hypothetical protein